MTDRLLAVLGPTATGKSALGLGLAERLGGEIINCDSTAVYRGFDIGTDKVRDAERYDRLTYLEVLSKDLQVMDASAISLARESGIPILVFSIPTPGAFAEVVAGRGRFTIITEQEGA